MVNESFAGFFGVTRGLADGGQDLLVAYHRVQAVGTEQQLIPGNQGFLGDIDGELALAADRPGQDVPGGVVFRLDPR